MGVGVVAVVVWAVALSIYDIRQRRLPNLLTLPGVVVILAGAAVAGRGVFALAGAAALAGLYLVMHLLAPAAMGAGDVKLAIGLGAADRAVRRRRGDPPGRTNRAARPVEVRGHARRRRARCLLISVSGRGSRADAGRRA